MRESGVLLAMHDCRKTREDLIDLLFGELEAEEELRLTEEMKACGSCRAEYHSMREAIDKFDEAAPAMLPAGQFWVEHHSRLEERLDLAAETTRTSTAAAVVPFWRRTWRASFSIPVPAAIAAALLLAATTVIAMRSFIFRQDAKRAPQEAAATTTTTKIEYVEVPVIQRVVEEKVVTRTVYVTKRGGRGEQAEPSLRDLPNITARRNEDETTNARRATLNGFLPPPDVKLTVIKGSPNDEK